MTPPLVSVIIPAYNSGEQIRATIQSVLKQTYPRVEIVIVDDASKDGTWQILQDYRSAARLLRHESNQGISASRNQAIQAASGDYIALLDHDDLWDPEKLSKQMALFEKNPALGLVFSDTLCTDLQDRRWRYFQIYPPARGNVLNQLIRGNFVPCPTIVIPKRVVQELGAFDSTFACGEEYELCLRIAKRFPIDYVDAPLATYRIHGGNFSSDILNGLERIELLRRYAVDLPLTGDVAVHHFFLSRICFKKKRIGLGLVQLAHGIGQALRNPAQFARASWAFFRMKRTQKNQLIELFGKWKT